MEKITIKIKKDSDGVWSLKTNTEGVSTESLFYATTKLLPELINRFTNILTQNHKAFRFPIIMGIVKSLTNGSSLPSKNPKDDNSNK